MSWYYAENGKQNGPIPDAEWQSLTTSGQIKSDTLVWKEGMSEWQAYAKVSGGEVSSTTALAPSLPGNAGGVTCSYCKQSFPADEVIPMGGQMVCASCKPVAVQLLKEGVAVPGVLAYAGFWIRFGAKFIDGIIGYLIAGILGFVVGLVMPTEGGTILAAVMGVVVQAAYMIYFTGKFGATLGKMACGLRVVRPDGQGLSYGRATGRYFAEYLSSFTLLIGYIIAAFDPERRALHDRVADTRVVKK